jgi:ParB family chromosome partitioning protein
MPLTINPKFKFLLPALSADEYAALRKSIATEGCRDPLVVWRGQIVDGHNRFEICQAEGVDFDVREVEFADEDAAMDWIDANQIARRNLSPDDFRLAVGRRYNRTKRQDGGHGDQKSGGQNVRPNQAAAIAAESGVDERTVRRAGKLAEAVEHVQQAEPEVVAKGREAVIERAKETIKPHVANNGGDNEWYTPKPYIEAARAVMGKIDVDPASSCEANKVVKAESIYTAEDSGLKHDWVGKLWMNPPYSSELVGKFIEKLAASVESGKVTEALVLVNNATETRWFARLASVSAALCFPVGRVKFWHPRKVATPLQGQAVAYIGKHRARFIEHFRQFGTVAEIVA